MRRGVLQLGTVVGAAGASVASAAAAICCVGPLALTLLGVQGMIFAAGIKPYRGYLLGASFLMLATAHWWVRREGRSGAACSIQGGRWTRTILWLATGVFIAAVLLQVAAAVFGW